MILRIAGGGESIAGSPPRRLCLIQKKSRNECSCDRHGTTLLYLQAHEIFCFKHIKTIQYSSIDSYLFASQQPIAHKEAQMSKRLVHEILKTGCVSIDPGRIVKVFEVARPGRKTTYENARKVLISRLQLVRKQ